MSILRSMPANYHKLPASHRSTYSLQHTLENLGHEPRVASTAIDLVLGLDPGLPGEETELDGPADSWEPPVTGPDPEDLAWLDTLDLREAALYAARQDDRYEAMYGKAVVL